MEERRVRIGDVVDNYCSRCKLMMNHGVIAVAGTSILKVRCNTCLSEHAYRKGKGPRKKDPLKAAYDEVLGKIPGLQRPPKPPSRDEPPEED